MAQGQTTWLLAWQKCWHIVGQAGIGTVIKGGATSLAVCPLGGDGGGVAHI